MENNEPEVKLTPTEDLIMEVLVARYRLGEHMWTFPSHLRTHIEKLSEKGLASYHNGIVEKTCRASLTSKGLKMYVSDSYVPPIFLK